MLTLLFTDIENSSAMWDSHRSDMAVALVQHNELLRSVIANHGGFVVKDKGDGFFAGFLTPAAAIGAVVEAQRQINAAAWPESISMKVRMGLHTGTVEAHEGDYHGPTVNQVARIEGVAHGGQVLLSATTVGLIGGDYPEGVGVRELGKHSLKGISAPVEILQLVAPDLPDDFPHLVTGQSSGIPLPDFATSFVGRDNDRQALTDAFTSNGTRLVTLLGPGGIGKTRLAVETARQVAPALDSAAFFADLTSVQQAGDVPGVLAAALGVHAEGAVSPVQLVAERVTDPTLLVVDNFEHVSEANSAIGELMSAVASMRILATSRTPLQVRGEHIYRVDPLSLADGNGHAPPAVQLFYDRAAGYGVEIPTSGPGAEAARSIVERVDGLPLGIELVAARTRVLSVTELDERLRESMKVIGRGGDELPERQRTLQSTIDWSLSNVSEAQQKLYRRLATLPAGATLKLLEEVTDFGLDEDILDALQGLVDNSLVRSEPGLPGGTRFRQLAPMRERGLQLLREAGEVDEVMGRLVDYYVDGAPALGRRFEFDSHAEHDLKADHQNLLAAMRWSLDHDRAADLAEAFNHFWIYFFNADTGFTAIDWLRAADPQVDSPYMDWLAGLFAFQTGDMEVVADRMTTAMEGFRHLGDERSLNRAKWFAGAALPDLEQGKKLLVEARDYFTDERDGISRFLPLLFLSINCVQRGELDEVVGLRTTLLDWAIKADYRVLISWAHWNLALGHIAMGEFETAEKHARETVRMMTEDKYLEGTASAIDLIGIIRAQDGELEDPLRIFGAAEVGFEKVATNRWFESEMFVDRIIEQARESLGEARVESLMTEGRALHVDEAVALANQI